MFVSFSRNTQQPTCMYERSGQLFLLRAEEKEGQWGQDSGALINHILGE